MEIKVKIHRLFNNDYSNVRAAASMTLDGVLAVHGVKVMTNSKGGTWVKVLEIVNTFDEYDALKQLLTDKGIPEDEIAYIHNAKSEMQKKNLFAQVRSGKVRVLIGSTQKMGAGTNVQERLIALHHLDCPWRPSDLEQREGRIIRQGNGNAEVEIYRYVTEETFDSYKVLCLLRRFSVANAGRFVSYFRGINVSKTLKFHLKYEKIF